MLYPVNEIFYSIQGEGYHSGRAAAFVRLAGCNLKCPWCDTNHTAVHNMSAEDIVDAVLNATEAAPSVSSVIITGGEPTIHNIHPLTLEFQKEQISVAVETNGTGKYIDTIRHPSVNWITLSPKPQHPPTKEVIGWANEIKVVLDGIINPNVYFREDLKYKSMFIQPCSENYRPALDFVLKNPGWKLSIQIQKVIGVR